MRRLPSVKLRALFRGLLPCIGMALLASGAVTRAGESVSSIESGSPDRGPISKGPAECSLALEPYDTSSPTSVVGDGTPESCTFAALQQAVQQGGTIVFDGGPDPVTIVVSEVIEVPPDRDTIIDGAGLVTLAGGGENRIFEMNGSFSREDPSEPNSWFKNTHKLVLQRLHLTNGFAPRGEYFPQNPENPQCAFGYKEGSGGAVRIRDGVLEVIDCEFTDNHAAPLGPDIAGGAIYGFGIRRLTVSGSRFVGNSAANGGAIGVLSGNPLIVNSVFERNTAIGRDRNTRRHDSGCPFFNHQEQGGAGGLGGAVYFDNPTDRDFVFTLCGSVFRNNRANEMAGAVFRTVNYGGTLEMLIEHCTFDGNSGGEHGGVSFILVHLQG